MRFFFSALLLLAILSMGVALMDTAPQATGKIPVSYSCVDFWAKHEQVALFNTLHPSYEVTIDTGNTGAEKVIVQCLAGIGPDLFNAYSAFQSSAFINAGIAWDITDEMAQAGIDVEADTWPATHSFILRNGRVYGFPYAAHTDALYFNKKIFDECGVPYPAGLVTWEQFLDLAKRLTVYDKSGHIKHFGALFRWESNWRDFIRQWGGRVYTEGGARCILDSEENIQAIQRMQDLVWKHRVSPTTEQESGMAAIGGWGSGTITWFGGRRSAMCVGGRYCLVAFRHKDQYPDLKVGVAEYQFGPRRTYNGYAGCVMINKESPRRLQALEYLKYMAGREYSELVNSQADGLAPMKRHCYSEAFLHDPKHPEEDHNSVWRSVLEHSEPDEVSPFVDGSVEARIIGDQMDFIKINTKTVSAALTAAAQQINAAIEKNVGRDPSLRALHRRLSGKERP